LTENHELTGLPPKSGLSLPNQPHVIGRTDIGSVGQPVVFWPDSPEIEKEITLPCAEGILVVAGIPERLEVVNVRFCCRGRTDHLIMEPKNRPMVEPERP